MPNVTQCCGAPTDGGEATGKYYTRHQRGGKGYQPSPPCEAARKCMNLQSQARTADQPSKMAVVEGADELPYVTSGVFGFVAASCVAGEDPHWKPHGKDEAVWYAHHRKSHTDRLLVRGPIKLTAPQAALHCPCVGRTRPAGPTGSTINSYTSRGRRRR